MLKKKKKEMEKNIIKPMITKRENDENPEQRFTKIISNTGLNNGKTLLEHSIGRKLK